MANFSPQPKEKCVDTVSELIEDMEFKLQKQLNRLSPKEKRSRQHAIDFWKSILYYLKA